MKKKTKHNFKLRIDSFSCCNQTFHILAPINVYFGDYFKVNMPFKAVGEFQGYAADIFKNRLELYLIVSLIFTVL